MFALVCITEISLMHVRCPEQAQAAKQGVGESRRWNFSEMQNLKKKVVQASVDDEHKPTEIFVMLPLDIIAVGEFKEGA